MSVHRGFDRAAWTCSLIRAAQIKASKQRWLSRYGLLVFRTHVVPDKPAPTFQDAGVFASAGLHGGAVDRHPGAMFSGHRFIADGVFALLVAFLA